MLTLKDIGQEYKPIGLEVDIDHVVKCGDCGKPIMVYKQVWDTKVTYPLVAKCCYCGGLSNVYSVPADSRLGGYFELKPGSTEDTKDLTRAEYKDILSIEGFTEQVVYFETFKEN